MKILHIITGLEDGGAEAALFRLCLRSTAHEHVVVSLCGTGKYGPLLEAAGVQVHAVGMRRGRISWVGFRRLFTLIRAQQPDVVQTWMYHADLAGGLAARLARRPVVWGIHNALLEPESSSRLTRAVARASATLSRWLPRYIVSCSNRGAEIHGELGYDRQRMIVIPNGYNLTEFAPDADARKAFRSEIGASADALVLGFVARWHPDKNHELLLSALAEFLGAKKIDLKCVLAGVDCDEKNGQLVQLIAKYGLEGVVVPVGRRNDVPRVMNGLDVHILSSRTEAFPNVVAEAMSCGTPCIVTDVGDAASIAGETGWVVPRDDCQALADAIASAINAHFDQLGWQRRQRACRERIGAEFAVDRMVASYGRIWEQAADANADSW